MNKIAIALTALIICSSAASAAENSEIKGAGAISCGEWVEDRKNGNWFDQIHWVQGYLSAYNVLVYRGKNPNGIFGSIHYKALTVWLDSYCGKNPLSSLASGMPVLISELNRRQ